MDKFEKKNQLRSCISVFGIQVDEFENKKFNSDHAYMFLGILTCPSSKLNLPKGHFSFFTIEC